MRATLEAMKTAYIFHDSFSDPFGEWYPWMKTTLEGMGYLVIVPKFPSPAGQSYESWKVVIKNYIETFDTETLLIGHGTGAVFAMRLVENALVKIRGLFIIAGYGEPIGNIGYDRINKTFYEPELDWKKVIAHTSLIRIYAGENDPFVPRTITERLAQNLGEIIETIPEGGHLGKAAGFTELVVVASSIKESLSELDKSIALEQSPEGMIELEPSDIHSIKEAEEFIQGKPIIHTDSTNTADSLATTQPQETSGATIAPEVHAHTMYQDLSKIVQSNRGRVAATLLTKARTEKAEHEEASPASGKNIIYTILSLITIGISIALIIFLVQKYTPATIIPPAPEVISLIRSEEHERIVFGEEPSFILEQKIRAALEKPMTDDTIRDIYYVTNNARASFTSLLKTLNVTDIPVGLTAEFPESASGLPVFMHGLSIKNQKSRHFLVIRLTNYDTALDLIKQWEPTMTRELGPLMSIPSDFLRTRLTRDTFTDELIQNKNIRVLRYKAPATISLENADSETSGGETPVEGISNAFADAISPYEENELVIAYFFLNEKTLIILDDLDIIPELLKRYADRQIYQ